MFKFSSLFTSLLSLSNLSENLPNFWNGDNASTRTGFLSTNFSWKCMKMLPYAWISNLHLANILSALSDITAISSIGLRGTIGGPSKSNSHFAMTIDKFASYIQKHDVWLNQRCRHTDKLSGYLFFANSVWHLVGRYFCVKQVFYEIHILD